MGNLSNNKNEVKMKTIISIVTAILITLSLQAQVNYQNNTVSGANASTLGTNNIIIYHFLTIIAPFIFLLNPIFSLGGYSGPFYRMKKILFLQSTVGIHTIRNGVMMRFHTLSNRVGMIIPNCAAHRIINLKIRILKI